MCQDKREKYFEKQSNKMYKEKNKDRLNINIKKNENQI